MKLTLVLLISILGLFVFGEAIRVRPIQKTFYSGMLNKYRPYRVHPYLRKKYYGNNFSRRNFYGNKYGAVSSMYKRRRVIPRKPINYRGYSTASAKIRPVQVSSYRPVTSSKKYSYPKPAYYHKQQPRIPVCRKNTIFVCKKVRKEHGAGKCFSLCKKGKPCIVSCMCFCTHKKPIYNQNNVILKLTSLRVNIPICHKKEFLRCTARYSYAATHRGCTIACSAGFCGVGCNCVCKFEANLGRGFDIGAGGQGGLGLGAFMSGGNGAFFGDRLGFIGGGFSESGDIGKGFGGGGGKIKEENIEVKIDVTDGGATDGGIIAAGGDKPFLGGIGGTDLGFGGGVNLDLGAIPDLTGTGGLDLGAINAIASGNTGDGANDPILLVDPTQPAGAQSNINIIPGSESPGLDNLGLFPDGSGPDLSLDLNAPGALDALNGIPVDPALGTVGIAVGNDPIVDSGAVNDALNLPDFIPDIGISGVGGRIGGNIDFVGSEGGVAVTEVGSLEGGFEPGLSGSSGHAIDGGHGTDITEGSHLDGNIDVFGGGHGAGHVDAHGGGHIDVHAGAHGGGQTDGHLSANGAGHFDFQSGGHAEPHIDIHGVGHGEGHFDGHGVGQGGSHFDAHGHIADGGFVESQGHGHEITVDGSFGGQGHAAGIDGSFGGTNIDGGHGGGHGGRHIGDRFRNNDASFGGLARDQVQLLDPSVAPILPLAMGKQPDRDRECRSMGRRLWCEVRQAWRGTPGVKKWCNTNCSKGACNIDRCQCDCVSTDIYRQNMGTV